MIIKIILACGDAEPGGSARRKVALAKYVCIYIYIYTYTCVWVHVCMYVYIYIHYVIYIYIYIGYHIYIYILFIDLCVCDNIYIYILA